MFKYSFIFILTNLISEISVLCQFLNIVSSPASLFPLLCLFPVCLLFVSCPCKVHSKFYLVRLSWFCPESVVRLTPLSRLDCLFQVSLVIKVQYWTFCVTFTYEEFCGENGWRMFQLFCDQFCSLESVSD